MTDRDMLDADRPEPLIRLASVSKLFRLKSERHTSLQERFVNFGRRKPATADVFWSLRDVSLTLRPGESIGILGQNGSGKSTLLKVITGILEPTAGSVFTRGRIAALLELGAGFHPELTGLENVYLNGAVYGIGRKEMRRKLDSIIEFAELGEFIDMPVKNYSSGMYVRLGFAVAIHTSPDVLVVDEVLTVGDMVFQQKCLQRITEMQEAGIAIVLVSHSLEEIRRLCQRAIWMQNGRVHRDGEAGRVVDEYLAFSNDMYYTQRREQQTSLERNDPEEPTPGATLSATNRWGTFQTEITRVDLLNEQGEVNDQFEHGASIRIQIHYIAHQRVERPTFGLAIYRHDGAHVNGPNSVDEGYHLESIEGTGVMEYRIEQLPLNPGQYELTVAIYNHNSTLAFDHHHRAYRFYVKQSGGKGEEGVVHIAAAWQHVPAEVISFHTKTA